MFVYIVGNIEQNIFRLGVASDPMQQLPIIQRGNPYALSIVSKVRVKSKNAAGLVESLGHQELREYEGPGQWVMNVPDGLLARLVSGRYLRAIADKADVRLVSDCERSASTKSDNLQRLAAVVKRRELTFREVLDSVERAYLEGLVIDDLI